MGDKKAAVSNQVVARTRALDSALGDQAPDYSIVMRTIRVGLQVKEFGAHALQL
jgi:hypothetical protein